MYVRIIQNLHVWLQKLLEWNKIIILKKMSKNSWTWMAISRLNLIGNTLFSSYVIGINEKKLYLTIFLGLIFIISTWKRSFDFPENPLRWKILEECLLKSTNLPIYRVMFYNSFSILHEFFFRIGYLWRTTSSHNFAGCKKENWASGQLVKIVIEKNCISLFNLQYIEKYIF